MIRYLTVRRHGYTMRRYLDGAGAALAGRLVPTDYEDVLGADSRTLDGDAWIFTDYDRLGPDDTVRAARLWRDLAARGRRLLNHPTRSLRRHALLRRLRQEGINDFDSFHLTDLRAPSRFPVFLRRLDAHSGPASVLLHDFVSLQRTIGDIARRGWPLESFAAVEFQDTRDGDGQFRKHGVMKVGGRTFPVDVLVAGDWMNKRGADARWTAEAVAAELDHFARHPHREAAERVFRIAGVEFGRIDFALAGGRMQVWEINTNPNFVGSIAAAPERAEATAIADQALVAALIALDAEATAR